MGREQRKDGTGRSVKVTFKDEFAVEEMMKNKHKLKGIEKKVFIEKIMSKEEQELFYNLRGEIKVLRGQNIYCYIKDLAIVNKGPFLEKRQDWERNS